MTHLDVIAEARDFHAPDCWPSEPDACRALLYRFARIWGASVALGKLSLDEAYLHCRICAETVQVSTQGAVRWQPEMRFATWLVDIWADRIGEDVDISDSRALRGMIQAGSVALARGGGDPDLRDAIAGAAERYDILPPVDLLHEAYRQAVIQARGNAKWIASRGKATP